MDASGCVDVGGKRVEWNAMAVLRFEGGKIVEQWVVRDELQLLVALGIVKPHGDGAAARA